MRYKRIAWSDLPDRLAKKYELDDASAFWNKNNGAVYYSFLMEPTLELDLHGVINNIKEIHENYCWNVNKDSDLIFNEKDSLPPPDYAIRYELIRLVKSGLIVEINS